MVCSDKGDGLRDRGGGLWGKRFFSVKIEVVVCRDRYGGLL